MKRASTKGPLSNAERQRQWRQRHAERLRKWRATLRVTKADPGRHVVTRNAPSRLPMTEEQIDDALTQLRKRGNQLAADYAALLTTPGLTTIETRAIYAHFIGWRSYFDGKAKATSRRPEKKTTTKKGGA